MLASNALLQSRYRIIKIIGQGGMGAVYQAVDERLGSSVAIKQTFFSDDELGRAFEREARLLANLRHPALPRVSDHFTEEGGQFLVMEFIPGDDLSKLLKNSDRPLDFSQVLDWSYQLLDALDYLHSHTPPIIHRDIKPQNLKLTERGQIILLDFGLAKGAPQLMRGVTASSLFGYTLNYAPLEQIQCEGTDTRADVYSAGATLHHLMTSVVPPGSLSRAAAIINGAPDPLSIASDLNPHIPAAVAHVISRAMSLRTDQRFLTAADMRTALREVQYRPSDGRPIFGAISTDSLLTPDPDSNKTVFENAPGFNRVVARTSSGDFKRTAFKEPQFIVDPREAPTRLMAQPAVRGVLDTQPMVKKPAPAKLDLKILGGMPVKLGLVGSFALAVGIFFAVTRTEQLAPTPPLPQVAAPGLPVPQIPMTPPPAPPAPKDILRIKPPELIAPADGKLKFKKGSLTMRWSPVPGAVTYKVITANRDHSLSRAEITTTGAFCAIRSSEGVESVLLIALDENGYAITSRWWDISH